MVGMDMMDPRDQLDPRDQPDPGDKLDPQDQLDPMGMMDSRNQLGLPVQRGKREIKEYSYEGLLAYKVQVTPSYVFLWGNLLVELWSHTCSSWSQSAQ